MIVHWFQGECLKEIKNVVNNTGSVLPDIYVFLCDWVADGRSILEERLNTFLAKTCIFITK